jgi:hypothetical protein
VRDFKRGGGKGLICLVGVQSNQFPHAVDLARRPPGQAQVAFTDGHEQPFQPLEEAPSL